MHFSFNLLKIKCLNKFRALLAHPQEALDKRHFVYCVRMPVGCVMVPLQPCHSQLTLYARNIPNVVCAGPPKNELVRFDRNMYMPLIFNKLNENCITLVSLY
jgi:hypothetical protein